MSIRTTVRANARSTAIALGLAGVLALSGCAASGGTDHSSMGHGSTESDAELPAGVNAADVAFTTGMIVHHQQAIEMSDLVLAEDGLDPEVAALAERIKAAQQPEIDRMQGWLDEWGVPAAGDGMAGMDHGGMVSAEDLADLASSTGSDAGPLFLEQMIVHHEGAVAMAEQVLEDGESAEVRALAEAVVSDQTEEIAEMRAMLAG